MRKVYVVPHTHWDREWYFTLEDSNVVLVEHMNFLIEFLETNADYPAFVFDCQSSVLDEYLKVVPENKIRLKNLIKDKRIFFGPWYTQCDTLNTKIESVIRNLKIGIDVSKNFGNYQNIGYLPDVFGQNSYLPSIFSDFELDGAIVQRGIYNSQLESGIDFNWVAPNGKSIKTNNIYFGYGPGKFLEANKDYYFEKLGPMLKKLSSMANDNDILLPAGGDQALIRTHFPKCIKLYNEIQDEYEFVLSDYGTFMKCEKDITNTLQGEFYATQKSRMHRTIHSQRVDIKVLNTKLEKLLIESLEPLMVMCKYQGIDVEEKFISNIFKQLFDVHAHDSIGGCNSDETNEVIKNRLKSLIRSVQGYINILLRKLTTTLSDEEILLINLSNNESYKKEIVIFSEYKNIKFIDDIKYEIIDCQEIDGGKKISVTDLGEVEEKVPNYYRHIVNIETICTPFSLKVIKFEVDERSSKVIRKEKLKIIEFGNKKLKYEDEKIIIINGKVETILGISCESDYGDSYDFSPSCSNDIKYFYKFEDCYVKEHEFNYIINSVIKIELGNKENLIRCQIDVNKATGIINFEFRLVNNLENARVRVIFKKDNILEENYPDSGFGTIKRLNEETDRLEKWKEEGYVEMPQAIYPFERFFSVECLEEKLSFINSNIKEYQVEKDKICLTFFRSVDVLGRDNLITRPNRASGINNKIVYTPDAQLIGVELKFSFSLEFDSFDEYATYGKISSYNKLFYQNQKMNSFENRLDRFELPQKKYELNFEPIIKMNKQIYVSCLRLSDEAVELRVFNPKNKEITIDLDSKFFAFKHVDLLGNEQNKIDRLSNDYATFLGEKNEG